jgi:FAD/FMN-containing dehydrogenase/Fe-S oxidoreductase
MEAGNVQEVFNAFRGTFSGDLYTDGLWRIMYATDASAYREIPIGVALPRNSEDIKKLIDLSRRYAIPLIPRTAGTSLAGQVVGNGLIVDVSKYMTQILEINQKEHWVRVQPGVILDELNKEIESMGLFFGPETSTSSRCMIGGMVGNNSCGAHSIIYGSTRDHVVSIKVLLTDSTEVEFKDISRDELTKKTKETTLEGRIYATVVKMLSDPDNADEIRNEFPKPFIHRRNNGYAIDLLLETDPFTSNGIPFNFSKLLAGSEGTLAFTTEIKLNLLPLPPKQKALICVHCNTISDALEGNLIALKYKPGAVELMDKAILDCTKDNIVQRRNRFFIEGDPGAILIIEFARETKEEILEIAANLEREVRSAGYGYHFPVIFAPDLKKVWDLRKSGLGVLSNYPGDRKPVAVTEDTAVSPEDLPNYIREFGAMMDKFHLKCVYHAHIGSGELHLRPVLNLKDPADVELFHMVALETAKLVKKYHGSLSGEHGDGRLRGEFIPLMIGKHNYKLIEQVKRAFDPDGIFNPNKIVDTPKMNSSLRFEPGQKTRELTTILDFTGSHGILRAAEQCNGSGDCRNTFQTGTGMCPSYQALKDENTTTRARANVLREYLTRSSKANPFDHKEIYEVMDLCLSCKACKSECPSNVDIAKLKAEFLQHYYDSNGIPFRSWLIANITSVNRLGSFVPVVFNFLLKNRFFSGLFKKSLGFAEKRNIPLLYKTTLKIWLKNYSQQITEKKGKVFLFADEFSNFNDVSIGIKAVKLLNKIGCEVEIPEALESGRTFLSKGLLRKAKKIANKNIALLKDIITEQHPLIGIEPSAILTFRDEYPDLAIPEFKEAAKDISKNALLFDEFLVNITENKEQFFKPLFTANQQFIKLHGHCQQKAVASMDTTIKMLSLPSNYQVELIKSTCCGMAGSFGYEKEHYDVSMKIGELGLFPAIRKSPEDTIICAPGTSCRHQIKDGTGRTAMHPIEVLYHALV